MRKRERDDVAAAARRRLEALSVELAGLRREADGSVGERPADPTERVPQRPPAPRGPRPGGPATPFPAQRRPTPQESDPEPYDDTAAIEDIDDARDHLPGDTSDDTDWFLARPRPVLAGAPGALLGEGALIHTPVGRALPPDPARVPVPGRHSVDRTPPSVGDWVEERLPDAIRGRLALSGQHLVLLTGVLGVALAVAGWLALRGGTGDESVPQARFVASQTEASGSASSPSAPGAATGPGTGSTAVPLGAGASGSAGAGGDVVVDVVGKVRRPGIVTLPAGSRVNDAVVRAGGARAGARTDGLNMARVLVDGEQIVVGQPATATAGAAGAAVAGGGTSPAAAGGSATGGAMVNLNSAGLSELDTLPGVGPVTAQKILDWRTAHGAFSSVDELLEVDGIGDKTLADIAPRATL